jgi:hypothetical protein
MPIVRWILKTVVFAIIARFLPRLLGILRGIFR